MNGNTVMVASPPINIQASYPSARLDWNTTVNGKMVKTIAILAA
jgi:hypothetical protein